MNMEEQENFQNASTSSQFHDTSINLICHYQFENGSSQFVFLDVENESKPFFDHSLCFFTETFVQTLASCNGLILLSGYSGDQSCYHVFNTLTRDSTMIPQDCIDDQRRVVRVGLASNGYKFEVVVLIEAGSSKSNGLEFHIFSCDTEKWRVHYPNKLALLSLQELELQELGIPPLYSNGAIHWEIGGYLLVYKVQESHCELFQLPNFAEDCSWQSTTTYRGCLVESRGRVSYCYTDFDGLHIWNLLKENDGHFDSKRLRWRLVQSVKHEQFFSGHQNFCGTLSEWEPYKITPIAYCEQPQIIYLQIPGAVVSYNFAKRNFGSICKYSSQGSNVNCCSFISSSTSGLHYRQIGRDLLTNGESELHLPIAEVEKILFL